MKIDLPITIIFDCQDTNSNSIMRAAGKLVCTLRYDTDGDGRDAILLPTYPPVEPVQEQYAESGQSILAHIPSAADKKVSQRAARSPYDYMVGTEQEREIAQEEADQEAAQDTQFGAGA